MPRENTKRGRRAEQKKRKLGEHEGGEPESKRQKHDEAAEEPDYMALEDGQEWMEKTTERALSKPEMLFYGMMVEEEQNYFRKADERLELNDFTDPEDRSLFLANVYREAEGKELRMACSQSSSRLFERLIQLSTAAQLKQLFAKFTGQFIHLVTHRFASHCCEALFIQSASVVSAEMLVSRKNDSDKSMENLFINALTDLENSLGYLMTDKFASHTLRVLLLVLSGDPIPRSSKKSPLQSRKKDIIGVNGTNKGSDVVLDKRGVPDSFREALERFLDKCNSGLNTGTLRLLATHQVGSPMIQLLLQLELSHFGKSRARDEDSLMHKLLPDDPITEGTESASFINGLVYDTIGSRLLETIIEHAPGRLFKQLYHEYFKERLLNLSKNDIASYVVIKVITRLGKDDLSEVVSILAPEIPTLVDRNRIALIRTLIERCQGRDLNTSPVAIELQHAYEGPNGFDISRLLKLSDALTGSQESPHSSSQEKLHGSLLAQMMLTIPGKTSALIFDSLARLGTPLSLSAAKEPSASHAISAALIAPTASIIFRRKMIQQFYGHVGEMALDPSASRVIDAVWAGTHGLAFIRERVAEELAENEASLRGSKSGRAVWHNWRMDLYKKSRREWVVWSRESAGLERFVDFPERENSLGGPRTRTDEGSLSGGRKHKHGRKGKEMEEKGRRDRHWTALEEARHKHAKEKERRGREARRAEKGKGKKRKHDEAEEMSASVPAATASTAS